MRRLVLLVVSSLAAAFPGVAEASLRLELNRLEAREDGACRVWLVLRNEAAEALDPLRLDLVMFGRDGVVTRRLAVDVGPVPGNRRTVRIFDLAGQACDGLGEVLVNDVLLCNSAEPAARAACAERLALSSRVADVGLAR